MAYKRTSKIETVSSVVTSSSGTTMPCNTCNYCIETNTMTNGVIPVYNFQLVKGETFNRTLYYKQKNKTPYDLRGYTGKLLCQSSNNKSFEITCNITNPLAGEIQLYMDSEDTKYIYAEGCNCCNPSEYFYQLELTSDSGFTYRIMQGKIQVIPRSA